MAYVDSNIWCYYIDSRLPEHPHVIRPVREMLINSKIFVNTVTLMEVAHYLTRNLDANTAKEKIDAVVNLRSLRILDFDKGYYERLS
jgi:predicted nucleic acid-binding protein